MKLHKVVNVIVNVMAIIGVACIICAAGTSDYYDSIGQYYAMSNLRTQLIVGCLLILPRVIIRVEE